MIFINQNHLFKSCRFSKLIRCKIIQFQCQSFILFINSILICSKFIFQQKINIKDTFVTIKTIANVTVLFQHFWLFISACVVMHPSLFFFIFFFSNSQQKSDVIPIEMYAINYLSQKDPCDLIWWLSNVFMLCYYRRGFYIFVLPDIRITMTKLSTVLDQLNKVNFTDQLTS